MAKSVEWSSFSCPADVDWKAASALLALTIRTAPNRKTASLVGWSAIGTGPMFEGSVPPRFLRYLAIFHHHARVGDAANRSGAIARAGGSRRSRHPRRAWLKATTVLPPISVSTYLGGCSAGAAA